MQKSGILKNKFLVMPFNSIKEDSMSLVIVIPNVSHLLIYKENWNKSVVMRKVIAEILKSNLFIKIYIGKESQHYCDEYDPKLANCAIINLRISGIHFLNYEADTAEELFAKELENVKNVLHFDNTLLSIDHKVSCIEVSIKIPESRKNANDETQAA